MEKYNQQFEYKRPSIEAVKGLDEIRKKFVEAGYPNAVSLVSLDDPRSPTARRWTFYLNENSLSEFSKLADKILSNKFASEKLENDPNLISAYGRYEKEGILDPDGKALNRFLRNVEIREKELEKNRAELAKRLDTNPLASEDEMNIGTYKENLETQVRDAVIKLSQKGYETYMSGFRDPILGEQFMAFKKDISGVVDNAALNHVLKKYGVIPRLEKHEGESWLYLRPTKEISLEEWKEVWDTVAEFMPTIGEPKRQTARAMQFDKFYDAQEKIRHSEDVYLQAGRAFLDGKVQKISPEDFKRRVEEKTHR